MTLQKEITVRFTEEQMTTLRRLARERRVSTGNYIRYKLFEVTRHDEDADRAARQEQYEGLLKLVLYASVETVDAIRKGQAPADIQAAKAAAKQRASELIQSLLGR